MTRFSKPILFDNLNYSKLVYAYVWNSDNFAHKLTHSEFIIQFFLVQFTDFYKLFNTVSTSLHVTTCIVRKILNRCFRTPIQKILLKNFRNIIRKIYASRWFFKASDSVLWKKMYCEKNGRRATSINRTDNKNVYENNVTSIQVKNAPHSNGFEVMKNVKTGIITDTIFFNADSEHKDTGNLFERNNERLSSDS